MQKYKKYLGIITAVVALASLLTYREIKTAQAVGIQINNTQRALTSSGVLVNTTSTLVSATTTNRIYLRISNLSGAAIYCTTDVAGTASTTFSAGPAVAYQGITIFGSSTYAFQSDENPYTGPVFCIAPSGAASTTVAQF